jgi:hypothetical protein
VWEEEGGGGRQKRKHRETETEKKVNKLTLFPWDTHYQFSIKTLFSKKVVIQIPRAVEIETRIEVRLN